MGNGIIAFIVSISVSTWIYTKVARSSGNNIKSSLTVAVISGVCIFGLALLILGLIPKG
jgi:hypothetical protein